MLGETDPTLVPIFEARGPERLVLRDRDFAVTADQLAIGGRVVSFRTPWGEYDDIYIPVHGADQSANAAIALTTVEAAIEHPLDIDIVHEGFANLTTPGRLEVMGTQPLVVIDGAHNPAGALALRRALDEEFAVAPRTLVVGLLREKNPTEMLQALGVDEVERLVCTKPPSPRALEPLQVADAAISLGLDADRIDIAAGVPEAVARAQEITGTDGQIVITGSLYVVGAARTSLRAAAGGRPRSG